MPADLLRKPLHGYPGPVDRDRGQAPLGHRVVRVLAGRAPSGWSSLCSTPPLNVEIVCLWFTAKQKKVRRSIPDQTEALKEKQTFLAYSYGGFLKGLLVSNALLLTSPVFTRNLHLFPDSSLRDGLFHEYKKYGKVTSVSVIGSGSDRHAVVSFKK